MNVATAESIAREKVNMSRDRIDRVSESANYFIFSVAPLDSDDDMDRSFVPPIGVHKKTGKTVVFNPVMFPQEITSIKRIR